MQHVPVLHHRRPLFLFLNMMGDAIIMLMFIIILYI